MSSFKKNKWTKGFFIFRCVVYQTLQIGNMVFSRKEPVENPGKRVRQKSGLNKAILEQGWGSNEFSHLLKGGFLKQRKIKDGDSF